MGWFAIREGGRTVGAGKVTEVLQFDLSQVCQERQSDA
jgi:hypothetical protein